MGELLAKLLKDAMEKDLGELASRFGEFLDKDSWEAFKSWVSKFELPATVLTILTISGKWLLSDAILEGIGSIAERIALRFLAEKMANDPRVQEATSKMSLSLVQTIRIDYEVSLAVFAVCMIVLIVSVGSPLLWKTLSKRRLGVFISFSHMREAIAEKLEQCLGAEGVRVCRIPYREDATHQDIVIQATDGIKKCDGFVCLPAHSRSYVDHEVLAATAVEKPITFLVSETDGTLPDTADKRYPVFRLEPTARENFKPLTMFLSYIGADLQSTWKLCRRAVSHPFLTLSVRAVFAFGGFSIAGLWFYCYQHTNSLGQTLINSAPEFSAVGTQVILGPHIHPRPTCVASRYNVVLCLRRRSKSFLAISRSTESTTKNCYCSI